MPRHTFVFLILFIDVVCLAAQPGHQKKPWEWTQSERFASRVDADAAASRVKAHRLSSATEQGMVRVGSAAEAAYARPYDVIHGRRDPHLFFEFELFAPFVAHSFAPDPRAQLLYRESKEAYRKEHDLPGDLWERLGAITASYRADRERERAIAFSDVPDAQRNAELSLLSRQTCRDRGAALTEARRQFGPAFSQFLYSAVAPDMVQITIESPNESLLRAANGECR